MIIWIKSASCKGYNSYMNSDYDKMFKSIGWEVNKFQFDYIINKLGDYSMSYTYDVALREYNKYMSLIREYNRYIEVDDLNKLPEIINKFGGVIIYPASEFYLDVEEKVIGKKIDFELVIYDAYIE